MATAPDERKVREVFLRERLTDKRVEKLLAAPGNRIELSDTLVRELCVRVGGRGSKVWSLTYRVAGAGAGGLKGSQQRMKLDTYPLLSLEDAREKARQALAAAARGIDPQAQRSESIAAEQTRTFELIFQRFIELHAKQNTKEGRFARDRAGQLAKAQADQRAPRPKGPNARLGRCSAERLIAEHAVPEWRSRLIETISRAEVHDLLDKVVNTKGEAIARELRKHLTKMFNWAADRGHLPASPMSGMRRPELGYTPRERVLSMEELKQVWDAAAEALYPFGDMIRLLILTGQRRSEVAELEQCWIDCDQRTVEVPACRYKTKRPHVYPLSEPAWGIVEGLPKWNEGACLFSTTAGVRPISGFSKAKARLDEIIAKRARKARVEPVAPWTVHDIRRSVATHMARIGIAQEHIERVLGHVVQGVAGTYNRYSYLDEKRAAVEEWGKSWASRP